MDSTKPNNTLLFSTLIASLGGLLFGFGTIVISGCQSELASKFQLDGFWQGFMTASALVGTAIGAILAGRPGDKYGRRDQLLVRATHRGNASRRCDVEAKPKRGNKPRRRSVVRSA